MANQEQLPSSYQCGPLMFSVISMFCTTAALKGAAEVILITVSCWSEDGHTVRVEVRVLYFNSLSSHTSFIGKSAGCKFHLLPYSAEPDSWMIRVIFAPLITSSFDGKTPDAFSNVFSVPPGFPWQGGRPVSGFG